MKELKPWIKLGIPKSTYYFQKSKQSNEPVQSNESPITSPTKIIFDGTNGNICGDITRADIERVQPKCIPNWYRAGCLSKMEVISGVQE